MDQQRIDLAQDNTVSVEFPRRQNRPTEQSVDDINMERGVQAMPDNLSSSRARETSTLSRIIQDTRSRDANILLYRYLHVHPQRLTHNSPSALKLLLDLHRFYYEGLLVPLDEVDGRSRGLTTDQISRLPTRVFKSDTGTDTTKCKSCKRRNRNAANLGTTNTEEPSCSAKVDGSDSKGAKGVGAMDAMKECNICMSEFVNNEKLRILTCFHEFHIKCIDEWIQANPTCPLCRAQVQI